MTLLNIINKIKFAKCYNIRNKQSIYNHYAKKETDQSE